MMRRFRLVPLCALALLALWGTSRRPLPARPAVAGDVFSLDFYNALVPLHQVKKAPGPYDWLASHDEPGQSFAQYLDSRPASPDQAHPLIYLVKLGDLSVDENRVIERTAEFLEAYFGLPVKFAEPLSLDDIPGSARRVHPQTGGEQVLSIYVIEQLLIPRRPPDAFGLIAFTGSDLWPGPGWNFVFGQASLPDRVGVWSIYRNGDPGQDDDAFRLCLKRTIKTGTHEIGHMLGFHHCVFFECNMNGSNHRRESDERPLPLCPVCLRKLAGVVPLDLRARFSSLAGLSERFGFREEADYFQRVLRIMDRRPAGPGEAPKKSF